MRVFVGKNYKEVRNRVPGLFVPMQDVFVSTSDENSYMRICALVLKAKDIYLVGNYMEGEYWLELERWLRSRLRGPNAGKLGEANHVR